MFQKVGTALLSTHLILITLFSVETYWRLWSLFVLALDANILPQKITTLTVFCCQCDNLENNIMVVKVL